MAKANIYAIKDIKGGEYNTPFFQMTDAHALRIFRTEVNRASDQNLIYLYPEDFELFRLGTFESETGKIEPENERLISGPKVKNQN